MVFITPLLLADYPGIVLSLGRSRRVSIFRWDRSRSCSSA
jgi:hypothetical protein